MSHLFSSRRWAATATAIAAVLISAGYIEAATTPYTNDFQSGDGGFSTWFSGPGEGTAMGGVMERAPGEMVYNMEVTKTAMSQVSALSGVAITDLGAPVPNLSFTYSATARLDFSPGGAFTFGLRFLGDDTSATAVLGTSYIADISQTGAIRIFRVVNNASTTGLSTSVNNGTVGGLTQGNTYTMTLEGAYDANGALSMSLHVFDGQGFDKLATLTNPEAEPISGSYFGFRSSIGTSNNTNISLGVDFDNVSITTVTAPPQIPGDFDEDGDVDGADFVAWQTNFPKESGALLSEGDADGDGDVDGADFVVWQTNFPTTPGGGTHAVPEPSAVLLLGSALLILAARRRVGRNLRRGR